ncbi:hypothetical protein D3C75_1130010 [compost metagenome]
MARNSGLRTLGATASSRQKPATPNRVRAIRAAKLDRVRTPTRVQLAGDSAPSPDKRATKMLSLPAKPASGGRLTVTRAARMKAPPRKAVEAGRTRPTS